MKRYEVIEHTADVGLAAYGHDLSEAFANAAYAMFSLMTDLRRVKETAFRNVEIASESQGELLVYWLNELLYLFDVDNIIFRRFEIHKLSDRSLSARIYGEKVDISRHKFKTAVKAATYHMLKIEKNRFYRVQVILDI